MSLGPRCCAEESGPIRLRDPAIFRCASYMASDIINCKTNVSGSSRLEENYALIVLAAIGIDTSWEGKFKILPPPVVGEGRTSVQSNRVGGERRLTFPPPSQPSPIKGEGLRFFECSFAFRDLCSYQCSQLRAGKFLRRTWASECMGLRRPVAV